MLIENIYQLEYNEIAKGMRIRVSKSKLKNIRIWRNYAFIKGICFFRKLCTLIITLVHIITEDKYGKENKEISKY